MLILQFILQIKNYQTIIDDFLSGVALLDLQLKGFKVNSVTVKSQEPSIVDQGKKLENEKKNIEKMCRCNPNNVSIDEKIPLDYVRDTCLANGISFGGNIKLTVTMLFGTPADNIHDADNCMDIGGTKGFILAPGCDIPFDAPPENIKAITSRVLGEPLDILSDTDALDGITWDKPDYANIKDKVTIDVITLDSESCAPCQYMMNAVRAATEKFGDGIDLVEHKIKQKESVA